LVKFGILNRKLLSKQSKFFEDVFEVVRLIPEGRVTTYGAIAKYLGATRSSRMVGYAMNASHAEKIKVPAHRVVNRNGLLTGKHHFPSEDMMQKLLEKEGVKVVEDQIEKFSIYYWDPNIELAI